MAASVPWVPFPLGHQVPVTPPPDIQAFPQQQPPPLSPHLLKSFTQELYGNSALGCQKTAAFQAHLMMNQLASQGGILSGAMGSVPTPPPWIKMEADSGMTRATPPSTRSNSEPTTTTAASTAATQTSAGRDSSISTAATTVQSETAAQSAKAAEHQTSDATAAASANDPRYLAMASRIAAYYHQRCQAVANFQQQRCQAWANMQRQKSQEMTQAAMLVIAWYIRDRIQRRRRRQKRQFRRGLAAKARSPPPPKVGGPRAARDGVRGRTGGISGSGRITKGEVVRKWILQVPEGNETTSMNGAYRRDQLVDPDEVTFDIDREVASDKDVRLYNVADNLIKSQLARIDVPLMGKLSFDASESESEDDDADDDDDDEFEEDEDDDNEDDYAMVDYEERGAGPAAIAVATMGGAVAARAGLGAGARGQDEDVHANANANARNDNDQHHDDHDDEYLLEDDEKDSDEELSALVHHASSHPREKGSYYS